MSKGKMEALVERFKKDANALLADMVAEAFELRKAPKVVRDAVVRDSREERLEKALSARSQASSPLKKGKGRERPDYGKAFRLRKKARKGTLSKGETAWLARHEASLVRHAKKR